MTQTEDLPPGADAIEAMAHATIEALPEPYRVAAREVVLVVEEFASDSVLSSMGAEDPFSLTGLYEGTPLTEKSVSDQPLQPDMIWLFRRPILEEWIERGDIDLGHLVAHIYVHELAHHFGWSDDDIAAIDEWWT